MRKPDFGKTKDKLRVRLKRIHFHDGEQKRAGTVIELNRFGAEWLIQKNIAKLIK